MIAPLLEARGLCVARGARMVLHDVDLRLMRGEALAVVGPNAGGKSTLVRSLAGLLPAAAGSVYLEGTPLAALGRAVVARAVAVVGSEEPADAAALTVVERVALGRYPHRGALRPFENEDRRAVEAALEATGIADLAHRRIETLSAGERQLAALARGLAQTPQALLLDEPGAHLDVGHQLQLSRILDAVRAAGVGVLMVVHDLQRAAAWADRMLLLDHGRLAAEGTPTAVLGSKECARAFGVAIRGHAAPGLGHSLYSFEEIR